MSSSLNFARNCQRYGVATPQCPAASLRSWGDYTKRRNPTMYETYYAPLLAQLDPAPTSPASIVTPEAGPSFIAEAQRAVLEQLLRSRVTWFRLHL